MLNLMRSQNQDLMSEVLLCNWTVTLSYTNALQNNLSCTLNILHFCKCCVVILNKVFMHFESKSPSNCNCSYLQWEDGEFHVAL